MTGRRLIIGIVFLSVLIFLTLAYSFYEYMIHNQISNTFVGYNATLIALMFAPYLAYLFQQRSKFVDDIRKWWAEIISAKSEFFMYLDKSQPKEEDYLKSFYKLSTAMDNLRLIYCNVQRPENDGKGYFPFEQVRDIIEVAKSVSYDRDPTDRDRKMAKVAIIEIFGSLRHSIQSEAGSLAPDRPTVIDGPERTRYSGIVAGSAGIDLTELRAANELRERREIDAASRTPRPRSG